MRRGLSVRILWLGLVICGPFSLGAPLAAQARQVNNSRGPAIDFSRIDAYVKSMPRMDSPAQVAASLSKAAKTDWEKARAVYDWICLNIAYDTDAFFGGIHAETTAASTFESGKSVCQGYSELSLDLAKMLGLESVVISGYSKGYSYIPGKPSEKNHAWNVFKIEGSWYLMDTTWGAGHIDDSRKFVRKLDYAWFAMDPELFIYTHFPEDGKSTLLNARMTKADFDRLPYVPTYSFQRFYEAGVSAAAQKRLIDRFGASIESQDWNIVDLKAAGFSDSDLETILARLPSDQFVFEVLMLKEYGFGLGDLGSYLAGGAAPKAYKIKGDLKVIEVPRGPTLKTGAAYRFVIESRAAYAAAVICGGEWTMLKKEGSRFSGDVVVIGGPVKLALRYDPSESASYSSAVAYEAR
ncbi:MAG TPA: transglutaminase domain-containing protein [Rectinemataceae bacterium]